MISTGTPNVAFHHVHNVAFSMYAQLNATKRQALYVALAVVHVDFMDGT